MICPIVISSYSSVFVVEGRGFGWSVASASGITCERNQNLLVLTASMTCARFMFSSTLDNGMRKSKLKTSNTMKAVNAAFSKSVNCASMGRNSVRQPTCGLPGFIGGGGLKRIVCQLVELMLSK